MRWVPGSPWTGPQLRKSRKGLSWYFLTLCSPSRVADAKERLHTLEGPGYFSASLVVLLLLPSSLLLLLLCGSALFKPRIGCFATCKGILASSHQSSPWCFVTTAVTPILQMNKLRLREVTWLAPNHSLGTPGPKPRLLDPRSALFMVTAHWVKEAWALSWAWKKSHA